MKNIENNIYDFILGLFTDYDNDIRPVFNKPFVNEKMVYATDAHAVIRMDINTPVQDYSENKNPPNALSIFQNLDNNINQEFNTSEFLKQFYSSKVNLDKNYENCKDCDGFGEKECKCCGNEVECKKCDGSGNSKVESVPFITVIGKDLKFFGKVFNPGLLYKVAHCALLLNSKKIEVFTSDKTSVLFRFDKVEIIIMAKYL